MLLLLLMKMIGIRMEKEKELVGNSPLPDRLMLAKECRRRHCFFFLLSSSSNGPWRLLFFDFCYVYCCLGGGHGIIVVCCGTYIFNTLAPSVVNFVLSETLLLSLWCSTLASCVVNFVRRRKLTRLAPIVHPNTTPTFCLFSS